MLNKLIKLIVVTILISTRLYAPVLAEDSKIVVQSSNQTLMQSVNFETKPTQQLVNQSLLKQPIKNHNGRPSNTMGGLALVAEMGVMVVGGLIFLPLLPFIGAATIDFGPSTPPRRAKGN